VTASSTSSAPFGNVLTRFTRQWDIDPAALFIAALIVASLLGVGFLGLTRKRSGAGE
jgi:hypothetical protein